MDLRGTVQLDQELDSGEDDKNPEEGFEDFLVDVLDYKGRDHGGDDSERHHLETQGKPFVIDDAEVDNERDFEDVDNEEEPGRGSNKGVLWKGHGKEIELGNGSGSVGEHCGDTPQKAEEDT